MPEPIRINMNSKPQGTHKTIQVRVFNGSALISTRNFHRSRMDLAEWHAAQIVKMGFTTEIVIREYPKNSAQAG